MTFAAVLRQHDTFLGDDARSSRDEVLARYRRLRAINQRHHHEILKCISRDALLRQARRLGLARGKTLILDHMDEMHYVYDLAIHTALPERSRAIDRYARSARLVAGSDEALVLEAMRAARFSVLVIERRHETAGLIATDLARRAKIWLVDIGLESSLPDGAIIATRLFTPELFSMTAGADVPLDLGMIEDIFVELPRRLGDSPIDHRSFAETTYRVALASGIMDRMTYQDLSDDA
jgi:hypothetical protein